MKLKAEDVWFSKCIRKRAVWTCEICSTRYQEGDSGLHCSHYFGRVKRSTRWHPLNCYAHCMGCHTKMGSHPYNFTAWVRSRLGETDFLRLVEISNKIIKVSPKDRKEIAKFYREYYKTMDAGSEVDIAPLLQAKLDG